MFNKIEKDVTDGIEEIISNSIIKSIINNSQETFKILVKFIDSIISLSISNNSIKHYIKYITLIPNYYNTAFYHYKKNNNLNEIYNLCAEKSTIQLKEILLYDIEILIKESNIKIVQKDINNFYYEGFKAFSRLFYLIIFNNDFKILLISIKEFNQLVDSTYNKLFELKVEINNLEINNLDEVDSESLNEKIEKLKALKAFDNFKRHTIQGIKYWIIYLFNQKIIDEDITSDILEKFIINDDNNEFFKDLLVFKDQFFGSYMGWNDWDYIEREKNKPFTPPNPSDWLIFGFLIERIRLNSYFVNIHDFNKDEISKIKYLYDEFKIKCEFIKENFDVWKTILKVDDINDLNNRCDELLKVFQELKKEGITNKDKDIAEAKVSVSKIQKFRENIGNAWKKEAHIHNLFKIMGKNLAINDGSTKFKYIGKKITFEKAKMMFIDGIHFQNIIGVDNLGGEIGRWGDDDFFYTVMKEEYNKVTGFGLVEALENSISFLNKKGITPDLIIVSPLYNYHNESSFFKHEKYVSRLNQNVEEYQKLNFFLGTFDNIQIYTSYSNLLKNKILVCNFKDSFLMQYKSNPEWFENELKVDVREITDIEADDQLKANPIKWKNAEDGISLSDDEAKTLIKTSMMMDIWTNTNFKVLNIESYVIGFIKSKN